MQGRADSDVSRLGRAARILVADDDPQNRELIEEVCRSEGFDVQGVPTGDQALEAALVGGFDLLLLDAAMPGMDGLEVCKALKAHPKTAQVPVMIVSASLDGAVRDRATELGAVAFISKPFRVFELSQSMRALLRVRSEEGEPPTAPYIRVRRQRADALSRLPSPSTLRGRLQREIDACSRQKDNVVCAVIRLENEAELSALVGRSSTDALLGSAVLQLGELGEGNVVRGDIDEIVALLSEEHLPNLALIVAHVTSEDRMSAGVGMEHEIKVRWGVKIADPAETDPDRLLTEARAAVEKAHRAGEPGSIDRLRSSSHPPP